MNCTDARDMMMLAESGEITAADARALAAHRAHCPACAEAARDWARLAGAARAALLDGAPSERALDAIRRAASAPRQARVRPFPRLEWLRAAAAALVVISLAGIAGLSVVGGVERASLNRHRERIATLRAIIGFTSEAAAVAPSAESAAAREQELRELAEQLLIFEGMIHEETPAAASDDISRAAAAGRPLALG